MDGKRGYGETSPSTSGLFSARGICMRTLRIYRASPRRAWARVTVLSCVCVCVSVTCFSVCFYKSDTRVSLRRFLDSRGFSKNTFRSKVMELSESKHDL